jgi:hypothetical protein
MEKIERPEDESRVVPTPLEKTQIKVGIGRLFVVLIANTLLTFLLYRSYGIDFCNIFFVITDIALWFVTGWFVIAYWLESRTVNKGTRTR